ncbi:TonB-dependent receptor [Pedobacter sp. P351]|uniref:TonB-dependent receptor domain-containing protein n=1 Tax=Pedobacter superstes TaxID=3133441 RepID=UPI0030A1FF3D
MRLLQFILAFSFLYVNAVSAQIAEGRISGTIIDAGTKKTIDFATIALLNSSRQTIKSAQSDADGKFSMSSLPFANYSLKISFIGYQPFSKDSIAISPQNSQIDLGTISLIPNKANVLKEVTVEAQRNAMTLGVDRKVFNVEQSLVSEGGSATDLLANVPTVSVDIDGNVNLRGSGNVRVLIDGKPSAIGGGDISTVLQSLPASSIESIELITNPSAKYDAEGQTGIINIVLKKNKKIGINGAVALSAGTQENYNANANLSYRDGNVNLYGNYSFRYGTRMGGGFNNTSFVNNGQTFNTSRGERNNIGNNAKIGFDYYLNSKTTIGASANMNLRNSENSEDINYVYQNYFNAATNGTSFRKSEEEGKDKGYDLTLDFSRKFKKQGEELIANFSFGQSSEDEGSNFNQNFFYPQRINTDSLDRRVNINTESRTNYNLQADYTLPFTEKQKLEAGYRTTIRMGDDGQGSEKYNQAMGLFEKDYALTNDFSSEDIVHALYANYQNQITEGFGFQAGLRAEQAYLNTEYTGIDGDTFLPTSAKGNLDYFRVYPSVFLTQKFKGENQLQLSYTRRVNRPRGWQVNPFLDVTDPNNLRMGNPNLRPEDIHSVEFSYMKFWKAFTLTSTVFARQVNDVVQNYRTVLSGDTTLSQFINISKTQASGLELISRADIAKGFNITANVNVFYNKFFGNAQYGLKSNDGYNWNSNLTSSFQLPMNLSGQINMNYMAPRITAQGRGREMFGMDAALRLDIMKKKGSLSFNMRDVFNSRKWGMITETDAFISEFQRRMQGRQATLTFSYRFGQSDLPHRNKRNDRESEAPSMEEPQF